MSCDEFKTVIRAELKELEGKSKNAVYDYFKNLIGEAEDVDAYDDGIIEWFNYGDDAGNFCPVQSYKNKQWGVDYVLSHTDDYGDRSKVNLSIEEIKDYCKLLIDKFGVKESDCKLVSYSWYNGSDEPIVF
jgi:hypothetical protein